MNPTWIAFTVGTFIGCIIGMGVLATLIVGRDADERERKMHHNRFPRPPRT